MKLNRSCRRPWPTIQTEGGPPKTRLWESCLVGTSPSSSVHPSHPLAFSSTACSSLTLCGSPVPRQASHRGPVPWDAPGRGGTRFDNLAYEPAYQGQPVSARVQGGHLFLNRASRRTLRARCTPQHANWCSTATEGCRLTSARGWTKPVGRR